MLTRTNILSGLRTERTTIFVILVLHAVGICGLMSPWRGLFQMLTPINLILTGWLVFRHISRRSFTTLLVIGVAAYTLEWVGVHTGMPFGVYSYGETLGPKISEVPPVIGLNWMLLLAASHSLLSRWISSPWMLAFLGAFAMVFLDILIEPVAIALDFWTWEAVNIPIQNYVSWWVASFVFGIFLAKIAPVRNTRALNVLFLVQAAFFLVLNIGIQWF